MIIMFSECGVGRGGGGDGDDGGDGDVNAHTGCVIRDRSNKYISTLALCSAAAP